VTSATTNLPGRLKACRGVLVDSNVLLDVATNDPNWGEWSARTLAEVAEHASLIINPIVYAEVSVGYTTIEALDAAIPAALYRREALPWEAGFLAGKCSVRYRRRGGPRPSPLPDFYIGAHAAIGRLALLTRDASRYRTYFPGVEIIAPLTPTPARPPASSRTSPRAR
jgi:predicted nucleic acid-binding protein